ncbi:MAG: hypothetical protein H0W99_06500 [Acidobacteria bacterium]|nr:hypothetical protein [Acidobacteriota bacterium]
MLNGISEKMYVRKRVAGVERATGGMNANDKGAGKQNLGLGKPCAIGSSDAHLT